VQNVEREEGKKKNRGRIGEGKKEHSKEEISMFSNQSS